MSLFGSLEISSSGLNANQVALQTSGNNIANANTDGYSRQEVNMKEQSTVYVPGTGNLGTGVDVDGVTRTVNEYVRSEMQSANSAYSYYSEKSTQLGNLENILNEPSDNGLINQLSTLTTAWNTLANNPDLSTAKATVVEDASTFADSVNEMSNNMSDLSDNITNTLAENVESFNSDVKQLQSINQQIYTLVNQGQAPNDLLDQRDSLLKTVSGLANVNASFDSYGRVSLSMDGQDILTTDTLNTLSVVTASGTSGSTIAKGGDTSDGLETSSSGYALNTVLLTQDDTNGNTSYSSIDVTQGSIGGLKDSGTEVAARLQELNDFAETIAKTVNTVYTSGKSSTSGFFDLGDDADEYAKNLTVNSTLTNDSDKLEAGETTASGDNSIATAMVNLANIKFDTPITDSELSSFDSSTLAFTSSSTGKTYSEAFSNIVTKNAISKENADNLSTSQESVLSELETQDESVSGVSLSEEFTDIIRYQRGFQANAKVLSTISDMLDTLINNTGA
ncbi:MAG: flagellar hook-associated protein FlgK [Liquorilactobacillus sp.]|uniref:flagellar hook-associated protein FlgK n=1 Tax=Liquorilactobacillus nagelii TaxID=82688 RepID=UPI0039E86C6F